MTCPGVHHSFATPNALGHCHCNGQPWRSKTFLIIGAVTPISEVETAWTHLISNSPVARLSEAYPGA